MRYYRYWAKANSTRLRPNKFPVSAWGYSNESQADAEYLALQRADAKISELQQQPTDEEAYGYGLGALPEQLIEELSLNDQVVAIITRNNYGSLVLNTGNVLFADIDLPDPTLGFWGGLKTMFGNDSKESANAPKIDPGLLEKIQNLCATDPQFGLRLYKTKAGYRAAITNTSFEPGSFEANQLLERLGSDKLYVRLCERQSCFRARLTPKPWRIKMSSPPTRFPFKTPNHKQWFETWVADYEKASKAYSVCTPLGEFGNPQIADNVELILQVHDLYCCGDPIQLA
ncbi:hypothetical protein N9B50_01415 [bacterium]|nr:hypothetical protein [bacterium]